MARPFHKPEKRFGGEATKREKKRFVLQEGERDDRSVQIQKMADWIMKRRGLTRPPLTKEQRSCGARRIA